MPPVFESQNTLLETGSVLSVSQLARSARILIEENFASVQVEGELSNFRKPGSGHWYFTLKDSSAQIRCAMFAGKNRHTRMLPVDGLQVLARGRVSLYEARGDFQLIVERLESAGEGALRAAFDALRAKLELEGLFEESRKQSLPAIPRHLVIVSSLSGAALKDVLHVIKRRFPSLEVTVIASAVQGDAAEGQLLRALQQAGSMSADVVLITRGGGSLEDLWAFNLESVARAVAACPHPVVSAIGHQTDFTITDFVADVRAPTPSAGAELITPNREELAALINLRQQRLHRTLTQEVSHNLQTLSHLRARLIDPRLRLHQHMQRADELEARMRLAWSNRSNVRNQRLASATRTLTLLQPARQIANLRNILGSTRQKLQTAFEQIQQRRQLTVNANARALHAVSPLNTLARGYSVLIDESNRPIISVVQAQAGERLTAHLRDGALGVTVNDIDESNRLAAAVDENNAN